MSPAASHINRRARNDGDAVVLEAKVAAVIQQTTRQREEGAISSSHDGEGVILAAAARFDQLVYVV